MLLEDQVVNVRDADLRGEARIDGAAARAGAVHVLAGELGVHQVLWLQAQALEIRAKQRCVEVHVQHTRHADAQAGALLHQRDALLGSRRPAAAGNGIGNLLRIARAPNLAGSDVHQIRIGVLDRVQARLDAAHGADVLDLSFFAGGDDQATFSGLQRDLRLKHRQRRSRLEMVADIHVDEGAQAIVLAEIAAGIFVSRGAIADLLYCIESDEGSAVAVLVKTNGLRASADRARLAAMLVHNNFWIVPDAVEVRVNKIDLGFHRSQVLLCPALQDEARSQLREVRNAGDIEEDIFRQDIRQSSENFFAAPTLPLKVYDVGLHKHRAAVAEDRHGVGRKSDVRVLLHLVTERLGCALQEIAVSGRALGIEFEVLDAAILQYDQLNVLAAHVHDDVGILVELHGRFGVRHGFHQRNIGLEHVFQNILGISGGADPEHFQGGSLRLHLLTQRDEHVDGVLYGIAARELIGLAEHIADF